VINPCFDLFKAECFHETALTAQGVHGLWILSVHRFIETGESFFFTIETIRRTFLLVTKRMNPAHNAVDHNKRQDNKEDITKCHIMH
jgi:hypothetical protein